MTKIPLWYVPGSPDEPQRFVIGEGETPDYGHLVTHDLLDRLQYVAKSFGALSVVIYPSVEVAQAEVEAGPPEDSTLHDRYYGELADGRGVMLHCNREEHYYPLVDTRRFENGHTYPLGEGDPICSWTLTNKRAEELGFELYGYVQPPQPNFS